jgi:hypothetical protein
MPLLAVGFFLYFPICYLRNMQLNNVMFMNTKKSGEETFVGSSGIAVVFFVGKMTESHEIIHLGLRLRDFTY